MDNFEVCKHGYNREDVDMRIADYKEKIRELELEKKTLEESLVYYTENDENLKDKQNSISLALTAAVEKAKQIEQSSQNVYRLKIQQINILYGKWEKLLNIIIDKYPQIEKVENIKTMLQDFKNNIKTTLKDDFKMFSMTSPVQTENDTIRLLLSKLPNKVEKDGKEIQTIRRQLSKEVLSSQSELNRIEEKAPLIKPIYENNLTDTDEYTDLADKFLTQSAEDNNAYSNMLSAKINIPFSNESGFNLKEAVNPKQDLDEIMKAFDFFKED